MRASWTRSASSSPALAPVVLRSPIVRATPAVICATPGGAFLRPSPAGSPTLPAVAAPTRRSPVLASGVLYASPAFRPCVAPCSRDGSPLCAAKRVPCSRDGSPLCAAKRVAWGSLASTPACTPLQHPQQPPADAAERLADAARPERSGWKERGRGPAELDDFALPEAVASPKAVRPAAPVALGAWSIWFDPARKGIEYESQLHLIGTFRTIQEFWCYWNHIDLGRIPKGANLSVFRAGVKPTWEDPANAQGGRWMVRGFARESGSDYFTKLLLCLLGAYYKKCEELSGIVYASRGKGNVIALWNVRVLEELFEPIDDELRKVYGNSSQELDVEYRSHASARDFQPPAAPQPASPQPAQPAQDYAQPYAQDYSQYAYGGYPPGYGQYGYPQMQGYAQYGEMLPMAGMYNAGWQ